MPVEQAIVRALFDRVESFDHSPELRIAYPKRPFTPLTNENWLRVTLLSGDTFAEGISFTAPERHVGVLQIDVFAKADDNLPSLTLIADAIKAHFKRGTSMTSDDVTVQVLDPPSIARLQSDAAGEFIPVRVPFTCFARPPSD